MDWQEVLTILIPLFALMGWVYSRIEKKADEREKKADEREKKSEERQREVLRRIELLDMRLTGIEMRLTRLEGRFDERGYWESREFLRTGTEDKK